MIVAFCLASLGNKIEPAGRMANPGDLSKPSEMKVVLEQPNGEPVKISLENTPYRKPLQIKQVKQR
jgi:hypothetical protein